jgi:hypothetical protein
VYKRECVALSNLASFTHTHLHPFYLLPNKTTYVILQHINLKQYPTSTCLPSRVRPSIYTQPTIHTNNLPRLRLFHSRRCLRRPNTSLHHSTHINPRDSPRRIRRTRPDLARPRPLPPLLPRDVSLQRAFRVRLSASRTTLPLLSRRKFIDIVLY